VCTGLDGLAGNYGANNPNQFGQEFHSDGGISLATTGFIDADGNVTPAAHFFAGTFLYSGLFTAASETFIKTNSEANLIISTGPASEVSFDYIDRNSLMNFSVNGLPITVIDNLIDLPAAIAPGVTLTISETTIGSSFIGTATLTGYITQVIIGGNDMGLDNICFVETTPICQITSPVVFPLGCDLDGSFAVEIDFEFDEVGSGFYVYVSTGEFFGPFNYSNLPVTIPNLVGDNTTDYSFSIEDVDHPNCIAEAYLGPVDCPVCGISNVVAIPVQCVNDDFYEVAVNFDHENTTSGFFDIYLDGQFLEFWTYNELPISMEILSPATNDPITLTFCDQGGQTCCSTVTIEPLVCAPNCMLSNPEATPSVCDANGGFTVDLDFEFENAGASFTVLSNGTSYGTFFYAELPINLPGFVGDNATIYDLEIIDSNDQDCSLVTSVGPVDCPLPCALTNLSVNPLSCTSNTTYSLTLGLEADNAGTGFSVFATGGTFIGNFNYADLPLTLTDVEVDPGQVVETFTVCDLDHPNCCISFLFDTPNCVPPPCELSGLNVTSLGCDSVGMFGITLDMNHANNSTQFSMYINGVPSGTYLYADLPLSLFNYLDGDGITAYDFSIQDFDNPDCVADFTLQPVDCIAQTCAISNIVVDPGACSTDSTYNMFLNFNFTSVGANGFDVSTNGAFIGNFNYSDLPLMIPNFPSGTAGTMQNIFICDIDNPDCCQEILFNAVDCTPNQICDLGAIATNLSPCDDSTNLFFVDLDFAYANTSSTFILSGNGTTYGTYNYTDLPIVVGPLAGDGTTDYEFVVTDSASPNCVAFTEVGTVNCSLGCELFTPIADPMLCTSDSTFSLYVDFDFANITGSTFNIFANGGMVGSYNYADLPLEIEDFPTMGTGVINLMVCDAINPNCCASTTFTGLDCVAECNIFEVIVEPFGCDQGLFLVELNLEYQNAGPLGFQVFGNGNNYGNYNYADLPITIGAFDGDGVSEYEFVAVDLTNTDCSNFSSLVAPSCIDDCIIDNLEATTLNCEADGTFMILLSFNENNVGSEGYSVVGGGVDYGVFDYATDALVGPFPGDGVSIYDLIVSDMVNPDCVAGVEVLAPLCMLDAVRDPFNGQVAVRYNFVGEQVIINMETPFAETSDVLIYDATGRVRHTATIAAGTTLETIDVSHLGSGLFICQLRNSDGSISSSFVNAN